MFGGGVSSSDERENIVNDIKTGVAEVWAGTAGHNCGGRCVTRAVKKDGKIVRILTDERHDFDSKFDNHVSNPQSRACSRCRSYVGRLYSPSRMKYPLKQTKKRGDLTGFVRISWKQAMEEIAQRYNAIVKEYGPEAIYNHMSSGQQGPFQRGGGNGASSVLAAVVGPLSGGYLHQGYNYSAHCASYFGTSYTGCKGGGAWGNPASDVGFVTQHVKDNTTALFLWGHHILTSSNPYAYTAILSAQEVRKNQNKQGESGKVYHINPTLEDTGITLATDWVQINPLTDVALISAMIHEMIVNTFDKDGNIKTDPWLDVDYLDTMVYGFFASPEYWIKADGTISLDISSLSDGEKKTYTKVDAVPAGYSYADYIMGQDERLSKAVYGTAIGGKTNYNSAQFAESPNNKRGGKCALCSSNKVGDSATFYYKKTVRDTKDTTWAEGITGVPAEVITKMAERICKDVKAGHSVMHLCSNGWQRNAEGVNHLFALQNLVIISKSWGRNGSGYKQGANYGAYYGPVSMSMSPKTANGVVSNYVNTVPKLPSCTMWHAGVKFAFGKELVENGYTGKYIKDMDMAKLAKGGYAYGDDANIKSFVKHVINDKFPENISAWYSNGSLVSSLQNEGRYKVDADGYYECEKDEDGNLIYSGIRFVYTAAGNAVVNQHMNANDTTEMLEHLPFFPDDPTNPKGFCLIALDTNFSPTMRWADYALPGTANWEMTDFIGGEGSVSKIYMPKVINGPGESKSTYEMNKMLARELYNVDSAYYGHLNNCFAKNNDTPDDRIEEAYNTAIAEAENADKQRWPNYEAFKRDGYIFKQVCDDSDVPDVKEKAILDAFEAYKATSMAEPFLKDNSVHVIGTFDGGTCCGDSKATDNDYKHHIVDTSYPKQSKRFHVLSDVMVWEYKHRNEKFHGYLLPTERGNKNDDGEGDPIVYNIPIYFDYRDYFKEAYGTDLFTETDPKKQPLFNIGTHIRYRSHSTFNESPLVRELAKASVGGGIALDTAEFAVVLPEKEPVEDSKNPITLKRLTPVGKQGCGYERLWMNEKDASDRGIVNGDLVIAKNPIGAVYAVACTSKRISKGVTILPQGGWYDPDPVTGIDAGGCANTIAASTPTRNDHGNAQFSIAVIVEKA